MPFNFDQAKLVGKTVASSKLLKRRMITGQDTLADILFIEFTDGSAIEAVTIAERPQKKAHCMSLYVNEVESKRQLNRSTARNSKENYLGL